MTTSEFDAYRQKVWEQGQALINQWNSAGTTEQRRAIYDQMVSLLAGFKATYDSVRCPPGTVTIFCGGKIPASWIDSRFHDFYDVLNGYAQSWQQMLGSAAPSGAPLTTATLTAGCEAGICGPVPPTQPLSVVATGSLGPGGVQSVTTTGGGVTVGQPATLPILQGGLAPSPYSNDLPGSLTPTALTATGAVAEAVPVTTTGDGTFDLKTFIKGPWGIVAAILLGLVGILALGARKGG